MQKAGDAVGRLATVSLSKNEYSALAEFVFNVGTGHFASSTLLRLLNTGEKEQVPVQLMRWTKAAGDHVINAAADNLTGLLDANLSEHCFECTVVRPHRR